MDTYVRKIEVGDDESHLDIEQLYECDTGGIVWDAGLVLISYMNTLAPSSCGGGKGNRRALDLGSGTGVVGMAIYQLGLVDSVTLTDAASQIDLIKQNVQRNFPGNNSIGVAKLCWEDDADADAILDSATPFSLITASDCVYGDRSSAPLAGLLVKLLRASPCAEVIMSFEKRDRHSSEVAQGCDFSAEFFSLLHDANCDVKCIPRKDHGEFNAEEISIHRITLNR